MSDSLIYYQCPSCSKKYQSDSEKSGSSIRCPSCHHIFFIPSKPTFTPDFSESSQHQEQEQSRLTAGKVAELFGQEHSNASFQNQRLSRSKLIDCPDCATSISFSAFFCTKCGRPSSLTAERAKTQGCAMMLLIYVLSGLVLNEFLKWVFLSISNKS